ncbi:MAG: hypothetical protein AAGC57_15280 [Pseudomonadota bacterium]
MRWVFGEQQHSAVGVIVIAGGRRIRVGDLEDRLTTGQRAIAEIRDQIRAQAVIEARLRAVAEDRIDKVLGAELETVDSTELGRVREDAAELAEVDETGFDDVVPEIHAAEIIQTVHRHLVHTRSGRREIAAAGHRGGVVEQHALSSKGGGGARITSATEDEPAFGQTEYDVRHIAANGHGLKRERLLDADIGLGALGR